jgi:hypothetical protein
VVIEDLGSRNGVLVNGARITGRVQIFATDRLQVGDEELELVQKEGPSRRRSDPASRRAARTIQFDAVRPEASEDERTRAAHTFQLLRGVVDKALALGRGQEAERLLSGHLRRVLAEAEQGGDIPPEIAEAAAGYGIKLAAATRKAGWINFALRVYRALARPLPMEVVHELYGLLRKVRGVDVVLLRDYVSVLRSHTDGFSASERFAVKRIEGLTTLTGL